jgi:apolipoprotein N-acyltransferase
VALLPLQSLHYRSIAALVLGALAVAGFAPFEWSPLAVLSLAGLVWLGKGSAAPRQSALLGYAWGLGFFLTGVSWIYVSLHDVGGMALPLAGGATLLFAAYLALFPALALYGQRRFATANVWANVLLFTSLWTVGELLRGYLFTGFPWLSIGYSQTPPSPLSGYAPLVGSYGLGWIVALIAAGLAALNRQRLKQGVGIVAVISLLVAGGAGLRQVTWTEAAGQPFRVSLLQGNIPQSLKWDPQNLYLSIESYSRLAQDNPADLVVLPETAIPLFFDRIPREVLGQITSHGPALIGSALAVGERDDYTNSAILLTPEGGGHDQRRYSAQRYSKQHLVPFGEYIPPGFAGFLKLVNIPLAGFTPGAVGQHPLPWRDQRLMPNICYEDLFGEEIRDGLQGEQAATVLINLSNTAWFGHSLAQPQHLQIARLRALESGRPMVRATNTGMTAAIEPDGRVTAQLPPFEQGALTVSVQGRQGTTPYGRWGNGGALGLVVLGLLPLVVRRRQAVAKSTTA